MTLRFLSPISLAALVTLAPACGSEGDGNDSPGTSSDASAGTDSASVTDSASASVSVTDSASASVTATDSATASATDVSATDVSTTDASVTDASDSNVDTSGTETDPSDTSGTDESTGTTGGPGGDVEVRNTPERCKAAEAVSPILPDEVGHLAATVLTPPTYPFEVAQVAYDLDGSTRPDVCDSMLAHRVELYVIEGTVPPADPADAVSILTIDVDADEAAVLTRTVTLDLETPIVLAEGQSLVVAVEMPGNDDLSKSLCVVACFDTGGVAGLDWWSNATESPYAWADMVDAFGFTSNFDHRMTGHTP